MNRQKPPGSDTVFIPVSIPKAEPPPETRPVPVPAPAQEPIPAAPSTASAERPFGGFRHDRRTMELRTRHPGPSLAQLVGLFAAIAVVLVALLAATVLIGIVAP
ncbi:MAG: hypothetical protein ABIO70_24395 [Pseudomonadota bacterium]